MSDSDDVLDRLLDERRLAEDRLSSLDGRSMPIIQSMTLLLGAGIAAARVEPEAFALVPVFWTVWLLYAQQVDRQTLKWSIYADWLEEQCNARLPEQPYRFRTRLAAARGGNQDVVLQAFPHVFAFSILLLTWGISTVLMWRESSRGWLLGLTLWMLATTTIIVWTGLRRRDSADRFFAELRENGAASVGEQAGATPPTRGSH